MTFTRLMPLLCASALFAAPASAAETADFSACVKQLRRQAQAEAGIAPETFDRHVQDAPYEPRLAEPGPPAPEFLNPTWEYIGFLVDERKVDEGRKLLAQWHKELRHIQSMTDVDPETVVAFFGVETDYGRSAGSYPVITSLVNRSCGPISGSPAAKARERAQLFAAVRVLVLGDVAPQDFVGSYAGAFGLTQFIPGTYLEHRGGKPGQPLADGDQDGKVDAIRSVPDALMLTALKVKADGWRPGLPWALPATLPAGFDMGRVLREKAFGGTLYGRASAGLLAANRRTLAEWRRLGVKPAGLGAPQARSAFPALTEQTLFALISLNDDQPGPFILASANFEAHYRYNYSISYAFAVGQLADRLKGVEPMALTWNGDDRGLSRVEIVRLQCLLSASHPEVTADGRPGNKTRQAIAAEETRLGRPPTGRTGFKLLQALSDEAEAATREQCYSR